MPKTMSKTVRVTDEQWNRIETKAGNQNQSPNHLLVQLAMEALDHREWPRTDLEIRLLRSILFTAEATARNMIADVLERRSGGNSAQKSPTSRQRCLREVTRRLTCFFFSPLTTVNNTFYFRGPIFSDRTGNDLRNVIGT